MALVDLIANSGAENYETMRRGWLPTPDEKRARKLADLQIQGAQQKVDYEPERQRATRKKDRVEIDYKTAATENVIRQSKKAKNEDEWNTTKKNLGITTNYIRGAISVFKKTKNIDDAKDLIRENYDAIIEAGDDGSDKMIDRFISSATPKEEAEKTLRHLNAVLPDVLKQMDKEDLSWKKKKGTSAFERSLQDSLASGMITQEEYDYRMDQYNQKLSGIQQDFVKIENAEGGYDVWDKANNVKIGPIDGIKSGVQGRHDSDLTHKQKQARTKGTNALRSEAKTELDTFSAIDKNINKALKAQESGDKGLSDKFVTLLLTQIEPTKFRAFKMYEVFDGSFGNVYDRTKDTVNQFAWGSRTDEQNKIIRDFLLKMQKLNKPVLQKTRAKYRSMAEANKYDVNMVVPFESFEDLKQYPYWDDQKKVDHLKKNKHLMPKKVKR